MGEKTLLGMVYAGYLTMCGAMNAAASLPSKDCGCGPVDKRIYPINAIMLLGATAGLASIYRLTRMEDQANR